MLPTVLSVLQNIQTSIEPRLHIPKDLEPSGGPQISDLGHAPGQWRPRAGSAPKKDTQLNEVSQVWAWGLRNRRPSPLIPVGWGPGAPIQCQLFQALLRVVWVHGTRLAPHGVAGCGLCDLHIVGKDMSASVSLQRITDFLFHVSLHSCTV